MNYYNYFTEIEDAFIRRRGRNLLLSPVDWAMIEAWQERGIPLHIVLRGIESVFDHFDKNPRPRTIKSLMFCREEVEAQFMEWSSAQVGRSEPETAGEGSNRLDRATIERHIAGLIEKLRNLAIEAIDEDIERCVSRLTSLSDSMKDDPEQVDAALTDIENFLDQVLLTKLRKEHLTQLEKEISAQLRTYRAEMDKGAYEQTFRLMLLKRVREDLGVPRMSLFYL